MLLRNKHSVASYHDTPQTCSIDDNLILRGLTTNDMLSGPIHVAYIQIKFTSASAVEVELVILLISAKKSCIIYFILDELGQPQLSTSIQCVKSMMLGIAHNTVNTSEL